MANSQLENMSPRTSRSRAPSKIPAIFSRGGLSEISESDTNARGAVDTIPSQTLDNNSLKHKPSNLPEPAPKRKTLAERAGEVGRTNTGPTYSSRSANGHIKTSSVGGLRHPSVSSSASSRTASSISSRNTSGNSGFNGSIGPGAVHPTSYGSYRPNSKASHHKNAFSVSESRAVADSDGQTPLDKRKGTPFFSSSIPRTPVFSIKKQRKRQDAKSDCIYASNNGQLPNSQRRPNPFRTVSITSGMQNLSLQSEAAARHDAKCPDTPSYIPKPIQSVSPAPLVLPCLATPLERSKPSSPSRSSPERPPFLNKYTNTRIAWDDTKSRIENMEQEWKKELYGIKEQMDAATSNRSNLQDQVTFQTLRINELETMRSQLAGHNEFLQAANNGLQDTKRELESANSSLRSELGYAKSELESAHFDIESSARSLKNKIEDLSRKHRCELDDLRDTHKRDKESAVREAQEQVERLIKVHKEELAETERRLQGDLDEEQKRRQKEVQEIADELSSFRDAAERSGADKAKEAENTKSELAKLQLLLEQERSLNTSLREKITESATQTAILESSMEAMKAKINFLESDSQAQSHAFGDLNKRMQEAIASAEEAHAKLRAEETLRRKLHNQVQELKGNIRVFCRVRPALESEADETAKITYPDDAEESKEVVVMGAEQKSSLGNVTTSKNGFSFDRVFGPAARNPEVFEEISQLVQSALDGYNVCIFCYGQTGSGKTHTMSADDGMIPLAVNQIYATATSLSEKGWAYTMEGSFVEVYNENLNDLLGKADDIDKKKHEIRHDNQRCKTTITDVTTMTLDSPSTLQSLLSRASKNRSVAATKANERSSRSHSVFILKLTGDNHITGERSEGVLNLVDLAGSERLAHSGATGERLKETQNINRSLSCLGDVIAALGQGKEGAHIPYRNSKLTYLLQHSLGGNSKTLMFVMISPLMPHLSETLTSLKFATKVHNTHIGTAKKQTKVRDPIRSP